MLSEEQIMEIAERCPVWYAIPQGREKALLVKFARAIEHEANAAQPTLRAQVDRANAAEAISASLLEINRDLLMRNYVSHELFQTGDPDCPEQALDWTGEVVLGVCKNCGRVEAELDEHCDHRTLIKNLRAEIASLNSSKG